MQVLELSYESLLLFVLETDLGETLCVKVFY